MIDLSKFEYGYQAIDMCHLYVIQGLLASTKPARILELGVGTGNVSQLALQATVFNKMGTVTCVDNWQDWRGKTPKIAVELIKLGAEVVTQEEKIFVEENSNEKFDFIISDGAHGASHRWCDKLYDMLNRGGVLIAHDVTNPDFPKLIEYRTEARRRRYDTILLNKSTREEERCERGLLVVYKS